MTRTVLVPVDGSPQSLDALRFALSHYSDSTVVALHVVDLSEFLRETDEDLDGAEAARTEAREAAQRVLDQVEDVAAEFDADVERKTNAGKAATVVLESAREHDVDQIVIGGHGRQVPDHVQLGSVAQRVVRRADVPVTVVR